MACSAAETMLEVGALTTMTPRAVAAGTSTLSRPTPARATTLQPGRGGDGLGVDLGGAAHDDRVGLGQRGEQRGAVGAVDVAHVEVVGQDVDGGGGQFLSDQDDGSHASSSPIGGDADRRWPTSRDAYCDRDAAPRGRHHAQR